MSLIYKTTRTLSLLTAVLLLISGCSKTANELVAPVQQVDQEQARQALLEQDQLFAEAVQIDGVAEAYRQFLAADAVQLPDGGPAIGGREEIYSELRAVTAGMDFTLSWEPLDAEVAASGELGYTWGIYYYEGVDELGAPFLAEGKYVYLWRNNDGRWEVVLDITNQTEPDFVDEASDYDDYDEWDEEAGLESVGEAATPPDNSGI